MSVHLSSVCLKVHLSAQDCPNNYSLVVRAKLWLDTLAMVELFVLCSYSMGNTVTVKTSKDRKVPNQRCLCVD